MDQFRKLLGSLSLRQRWTIGAVSLAIVGLLIGFSQWQRERNFHPLYTSLSPEDAAVVVQKLREGNTDYRLSDNGTSISVPSAKIAELRLELAAAGVPKSGRIGFELFDKTNFGMTEFTEHVNFRRALEGELERSVMSLAEVEQARVHLTFPKESVFLDSRQAAKASVLIKLRVGAKLSPQNVMALTHLVSSAVEGLAPEAVSVLDMRGNLLNRSRLRNAADGSADSEAAIEYQQKIEKDIVAKVNATLEPLLGSERFRTAASVECDLTSGEQSEETFDPTKSVMTTSQRTEDGQSSSFVGGVPGTASNLPRPPAKAGSSEGNSHRTEQISYQTSRTMKHVKLPQGGLKRISVAVLLDQDVRWDGTGPKAKKVLLPVPAEKIKTIHELVAAAIGFSTQRGDQLTIESLPFESTLNQEQPEAAPVMKPERPLVQKIKEKDPETLGILAGGTIATLLVLGFVLMLVMRGKKKRVKVADAAQALPEGAEAVAGIAGKGSHEGPTFAEALSAPSGEDTYIQALMHPPNAPRRQLGPSRMETIVGELRGNVQKEPELYASIMRGWLSEDS